MLYVELSLAAPADSSAVQIDALQRALCERLGLAPDSVSVLSAHNAATADAATGPWPRLLPPSPAALTDVDGTVWVRHYDRATKCVGD